MVMPLDLLILPPRYKQNIYIYILFLFILHLNDFSNDIEVNVHFVACKKLHISRAPVL